MGETNEEAVQNIQEGNWDDYIKAYYEKPASFKSWSGYDLKEIYTPEHRPEEDYKQNIADAGTYPYTKGIHSNMFRGRLWTKREVVGIGEIFTMGTDTHAIIDYLDRTLER